MLRALSAAGARHACRRGAPNGFARPPAPHRGAALTGFSLPTPKLLSEIVKLELLEPEAADTCRQIWETHHADEAQRRLGVVLSREQWQAVQAHAHTNPQFVLPVPKGAPGSGGFVTFVVQWQLPHLIFTLLAEYQRSPSRAQPHMVVTHYPDLAEAKGIVFARGEVPSTELSVAEARALLASAHAFYAEADKQRAVAAFNRGASDFSFAAVLAACGVAPLPPR